MNFDTVDTLAKFTYIQKDEDKLKRIKLSLSYFFSIEQIFKKKFDKRYLIFLTTILQQNKFPDNIKILTWNYDFQMELASYFFEKEHFKLKDSGYEFVKPFLQYYPSQGGLNKMNDIESPKLNYQLIHLNGIAGFIIRRGIVSNYFKDEFSKKDKFIEDISTYQEQSEHLLTFAWEESTVTNKLLNSRIDYAKELVKNTTYLIIIGYSFPFFNREIDKSIFNVLLKNDGYGNVNLKKIYFQDPYRDGEFLREQFMIPDHIKIKHIKEKDQFFVPFEM